MICEFRNKKISIPDKEIEKAMKNLDLSKTEAVEMWLEDNGYLDNEEQTALDEKAKKVKISHEAKAENIKPKASKPRTVKVSDTKKALFESILQNIDRCECVNRENVTVLKENKLISVKIGDKIFKIDVIETRSPKK